MIAKKSHYIYKISFLVVVGILLSCGEENDNSTLYGLGFNDNSMTSILTDEEKLKHAGEPVDLGLSVKWANMNVGAASPEEYGVYFAWGETKPHFNKRYTHSEYKWSTEGSSRHTKYRTEGNYVDNKTVLSPEDDAAQANWGGTWRMPTKAEQDELLNKCNWTWTTMKGINGYKVSSKINNNFIFLPAAGYNYDVKHYVGSEGYYYSASLDDENDYVAHTIIFDDDDRFRFDNHWIRVYGLSVRAVCP